MGLIHTESMDHRANKDIYFTWSMVVWVRRSEPRLRGLGGHCGWRQPVFATCTKSPTIGRSWPVGLLGAWPR